MSIKAWPVQERPREKLLKQGAAALSDAELLAILLRVGTKGLSAVELGRSLLQNFSSMGALFNASFAEFEKHKGLGEATYAQFAAVHEIAKRILSEELTYAVELNSSSKVKDYLRLYLGHKSVEMFTVLFLDGQNKLIASESMGQGSVNAHTVYIREVLKKALAHNASALIVAHNHPAGTLFPSEEDICLTAQLQKALKLVDVILLDHFLVTAQHSLSFSEEGWYAFG